MCSIMFPRSGIALKYILNVKNVLSQGLCNAKYSNFTTRYKVNIIPALRDNYMYVVLDSQNKTAIAIDPVEPEKVLNSVEFQGCKLIAVLTTHHHIDHAGGNHLISNAVRNLPVYGGDERIEALTNKISHESVVKIGDLSIKCIHTPCHTSGHICYYIENSSNPICFTGDTLFVAGCGRFFEGSAKQMLNSLTLLSELPTNTKIYCGHEYTLNNLQFALTVEPSNESTQKKMAEVEKKLKENLFSVPSTIGEELLYNPFMRVNEASVKKHLGETDPVVIMTKLRELKDNF